MKRSLRPFLLLALTSVLALLLVACGHQHTYEKRVVAPTCTEAGYTLYTCACGKEYRGDGLAALGHDTASHPAKAPSCTEDGWGAYLTCKRQGCEYSTKVNTAPLGHVTVSLPAKAPSCTEDGWGAYELCSRPGCHHSTKVVAPRLDHDLEAHPAKAPSCTEGGWGAYLTCKRQGCEYSTKVELPAEQHDYEVFGFLWSGTSSAEVKLVCRHDASHISYRQARVTHTLIPAGCTTDEVSVYTASYDHLGVEYTDERTVVREGTATGCIWELAGFAWAKDLASAAARLVCQNDPTHTSTQNDVTVSAVSVAPDCDLDAVIRYQASAVINGRVITEEKEVTQVDTKLGHAWSVDSWVWNGLEGATLYLECDRDSAHTQTLTAAVTSEIATPPTCKTEGVRTYTAEVEYDGVTFTDVKTETLAKMHGMVDGTCTACGHRESLGFVFEAYGDGWQISGLGTCTDTDIVIPTVHEGKPVLLLYDLMVSGDVDHGVKSITIPAGVAVRYGSLRGFRQLESLTLDSVNSVYGSRNSRSYTFLSALFGAKASDQTGYVPTTLTKIFVTGTDAIDGNCFYDCAHVTEIHILRAVRVNRAALNRCTSIEKLTLPRFYHTDASHSLGDYFRGIDPNNYYACPPSLRMLSIRGGEYVNADDFQSYSHFVTDLILASTLVSISIETNGTDRLFYEGTAEQWAAIRVSPCVQGVVYFYSETAPVAEGSYWHYAEDGVTPIIWAAEEAPL